MEHDAARAHLSGLIDGALPAREAAEVEAHLKDCAACRADLAQLRATVRLLKEVEPVQAPEGFAAAVRGRIAGLSPSAPSRPWSRWHLVWPPMRWSWKTAVAVASVLLVGIFAVNLVREMVPIPLRERSNMRSILRPAGRVEADRYGDARNPRVADQAPTEGDRAAQGLAGAPAVPGSEPTLDRKVIRTGQVAIEVEKFDEAARRLLVIAEAAGGFIADSSYDESGGVPRGMFILRVPASWFSDALRQVEQLGTVQRRHITGQDVTEEFVDLEARVRNLERQETRLLTFMDRATKIPDLMAIEQEVARVRGEIERLKGRLRFLTNRVDLATIQAEVSQKPRKSSGGFWDFDRTIARIEAAFLNTVRQLLSTVEGLAAFAAAVLPVAVLGALGWALVRRAFHRADRPA